MFPYKPRKYQVEMLNLFTSTLDLRGHLALESGTGSGKTVCALKPALDFAVKNRKKIVYVTRTNAQQKQVIYEFRQITGSRKFFGCGILGRKNMCPLIIHNPEFLKGTSEELAMVCAYRKRNTLSNSKNGCKYFEKNCKSGTPKVEGWVKEHLPTAEEFFDYCEKAGFCPYEITKTLLNDAILVVAPYIYFFKPFLRKHLLDMLNVEINDVLLIVDEAHNLPEYARSLDSVELSLKLLKFAEKEADEFGNPEVIKNVRISDFCMEMKKIILKTKNEYVTGDDAVIPSFEVEAEIMSRFKISSNAIDKIIQGMMMYAESVKAEKMKKGKLPRSYVHSVGAFLLRWVNADESHVKIVTSEPKLELYCLDPCVVTGVVKECFSSFHMSGTLKPLDEYRDSIGLPSNTKLFSFPSPFPKENRKIFFVNDVTTRYDELSKDPGMIKNLKSYIKNICDSFHKNIIVFFPSFELMKKMGIQTNKKFYVEKQRMRQHKLMGMIENFKSERNALLFSVAGGRISEGIDFPGKMLEIGILVGLPYPKPTAKQKALQNYYDIKFGKGWEYAVRAPVTRKTLQCIGRLIRAESDRGAAVILDRRAHHFRKSFDLNETENVVEELKKFFH